MNFDLKTAFQNEETRKKIILGSILGTISVVLLYLVLFVLFPSEDEKPTLAEIPMTQAEQVQEYNSKLVALNNKEPDGDASFEKSLDNFFSDETTSQSQHYKDEDRIADSLNKVFEKQNRNYSNTNYSNVNNKPSPQPQQVPIKAPQQGVEQQQQYYSNATNTYVKEEQKQVVTTEINEIPRKRRTFNDGTSNVDVGNTINVITFGDQLVSNGSQVKLRTTAETTIQGLKIPRNTIVYGVSSHTGNRLNIIISSIVLNNRNLSVNLRAHDSADGGEGLKVNQQSINNEAEAMKSNAGDAVINATGISYLPIIGSMTRGAKDLLTKRNNSNGIIVTSNYKLVLR